MKLNEEEELSGSLAGVEEGLSVGVNDGLLVGVDDEPSVGVDDGISVDVKDVLLLLSTLLGLGLSVVCSDDRP